LGFLDGFLDTAVNIGEGYTWSFALLLFGIFAGYVIYRFRHARISTIEIIGTIIVFLFFALPGSTIGALLGDWCGGLFSYEGIVLKLVGFIFGAYLGIRVWWWLGMR
jgi:hypothetical protein